MPSQGIWNANSKVKLSRFLLLLCKLSYIKWNEVTSFIIEFYNSREHEFVIEMQTLFYLDYVSCVNIIDISEWHFTVLDGGKYWGELQEVLVEKFAVYPEFLSVGRYVYELVLVCGDRLSAIHFVLATADCIFDVSD